MKWVKAFLIIVITCFFATLMFFHVNQKEYERYLMFFKDKITGEVQIENRYIALSPDKESLNVFVEEFLLGPANYSLLSFFPHGMKYKTLFLQNDVLYLDLPKDSLLHMPKNVEFKEFYDLFKKSLNINFPKVKDVEIFIEGNKAYEKR